LALARDRNLTYFTVRYTGRLGYVYALQGKIAERLPLLERAVNAHETMGNPFSLVPLLLAEAYVLAGRLVEALEVVARALIVAREGGHRGDEAKALWLLGKVAAHRDLPEQADRHYRDALVLAEGLGMRPLVAHSQLGLGKLYPRMSKRDQARDHLTVATTMYRDMSMTYWLEQAEAVRIIDGAT
jgi:tetratricopeptide (TPR) repeat protein